MIKYQKIKQIKEKNARGRLKVSYVVSVFTNVFKRFPRFHVFILKKGATIIFAITLANVDQF